MAESGNNGKKKRKGGFSIKGIVLGKMVRSDVLKRNAIALALLTVLLLVYIANKYNTQMGMENIKKLKVELMRVKTDYVNASATYYSRIRETEMKELVDTFHLGLESPECPPYNIDAE